MTAPKGYKAVPRAVCNGCAFWQYKQPHCTISTDRIYGCTPGSREDGQSVIFVKIEDTAVPATLLYPMGSLGDAV